MTRVELDVEKSAFENANQYFMKAKRSMEKLASLKRALLEMDEKIRRSNEERQASRGKVTVKRAREWFEKFHWFFTTGGFLVIAGRDRSSNEWLVKKTMQPHDVYFHATANGSAHGILQTNGKKPAKGDLEEAAKFVGIWSGDWKSGASLTDVYSVRPQQVSKQAPTGESMGTGAFMIYGERLWYRKVPLRIAVALDETGRAISGPESAVRKKNAPFLIVVPGEKKKSDVAKSIRRFFEKKGLTVSLDDVMAAIPATGRIESLD